MPPPSSGGITLAQILTMIAPYDLAKISHINSLVHPNLFEAEKERAYADRNFIWVIPDFCHYAN
jgi:gamma-glutamyltranspeptidase/glutathione hydrolase